MLETTEEKPFPITLFLIPVKEDQVTIYVNGTIITFFLLMVVLDWYYIPKTKTGCPRDFLRSDLEERVSFKLNTGIIIRNKEPQIPSTPSVQSTDYSNVKSKTLLDNSSPE